MSIWSVYLLRCADDSLYTGIAIDVRRRLREHEQGSRGAKYLQGRGPLKLLFEQTIGDRATASRVEYRIKHLSKAEKERYLRVPDQLRAHIRSLSEASPDAHSGVRDTRSSDHDSHSKRVASSAGK